MSILRFECAQDSFPKWLQISHVGLTDATGTAGKDISEMLILECLQLDKVIRNNDFVLQEMISAQLNQIICACVVIQNPASGDRLGPVFSFCKPVYLLVIYINGVRHLEAVV